MKQSSQHGIALVIVLWVIALLTTMATSLVITTRTELSLARNRLAEAQLRAFADAAVTTVAFRLASPEEEDQWIPDGTPHEWSFGNTTTEIKIFNEGSRIDLNRASNTTLTGLFKAVDISVSEAEQLANCIIDWRDGDDATTFPGGAEAPEYKAAGRSYGSKNAPFTTVAELRLVLGLTPEIITLIADAITLHGNGDSILQDYAPPLVLAALGITTPPTIPTTVPRNLGGPVYRVQIKIPGEGLIQEIIFRRGGRAPSPITIIERR